ncbi:MAG: HigA family addiction module antidote protein [Bacteroidales bacterium]|jgi:addiction module HigA family antidote|nr:HigA family addiction module antidote protein [Bacteroidales bacterium]
MEEFRCSRNIHPGEVMERERKYLKISKIELSKELGISYKSLCNILNEKQSVTSDIALQFEAITGFSANTLMKFQINYDIRALKEKKQHVKLLEKLRTLRKSVSL